MKRDESILIPGNTPAGDVLIYEYGVRLDQESIEPARRQIEMSRRLYNEIIACIRRIFSEMNAFVIEKAGAEAVFLQQRIDDLTAQFNEAKAQDNDPEMKRIAQARRELWAQLSGKLKVIRKTYRADIQSQFLSRIGRNSTCETYQLRSAAVAAGLGWATANSVLDNALLAFKTSMKLGRPPRFAIGAEKEQDSLTLQFTSAGGVGVETLLAGRHTELSLMPAQGCGRRKYGELRFRLGTAKSGVDGTGTWQYHRPLPADAYVGLARLVRRRIGKDYRWSLQLMLKLAKPVSVTVATRKPLAVVHMGWSADVSGRRVAGISDSPDPCAARIVQLPPQIEEALDRSDEIKGQRDLTRDEIVPMVKAIKLPASADEELSALLNAMRPLRSQYISANRLHYLCAKLRAHDLLPDWLETWRKDDKLMWQDHTHLARRARNKRHSFYRDLAIQLGREYDAIVIEPLALAEAAAKVNEVTGEKTEFGKKARSGRVVAALYELESAIRWAAFKTGTAVLELNAKTASSCSLCGGSVKNDPQDSQLLQCDDCGATLDRKQNGAALAYQYAWERREEAVCDYWSSVHDHQLEKQAEKAARLEKMSQGRREARTRRAA